MQIHGPGADKIEELALAAIEALPEAFRAAARAVGVQVAELAPPHVLRALGMHDPYDLSGLYEGIPLTEKSVFQQPAAPDVIWLFRIPILAEWQDRKDVALSDLVAHVMVHELAHHFGWSDDDIAMIDRWWE